MALDRHGCFPSKDAICVWTDASGHIIASPSLGIFVPGDRRVKALVASLALPRCFLLREDDQERKAYCKTTTLESLAYLATLCIDPMRFVGTEVVFHIDNHAAVIALRKGHSRDSWASTIVRAARVVAAALGCSLFSEWERRRSTRGSIIADELTHNLIAVLNDQELQEYLVLGRVEFPEPISQWLANPGPDVGLGMRCVLWMRRYFPEFTGT